MGTGLPPDPERQGLAPELHRLRSKLARLKGEIELAELDGRSPGPEATAAVEEALAALTELEKRALGSAGRVWVVDDDRRLAELTALQLRRLGFDAEAADGDVADSLAAIDRDSVLVIDLGVTDGLDPAVLESIRVRRPIVVSGAMDAGASERAAAIGASAFLVKPIEIDAAAAAIRSRQAESAL
jgi:CheY-like chemotaxis protein